MLAGVCGDGKNTTHFSLDLNKQKNCLGCQGVPHHLSVKRRMYREKWHGIFSSWHGEVLTPFTQAKEVSLAKLLSEPAAQPRLPSAHPMGQPWAVLMGAPRDDTRDIWVSVIKRKAGQAGLHAGAKSSSRFAWLLFQLMSIPRINQNERGTEELAGT